VPKKSLKFRVCPGPRFNVLRQRGKFGFMGRTPESHWGQEGNTHLWVPLDRRRTERRRGCKRKSKPLVRKKTTDEESRGEVDNTIPCPRELPAQIMRELGGDVTSQHACDWEGASRKKRRGPQNGVMGEGFFVNWEKSELTKRLGEPRQGVPGRKTEDPRNASELGRGDGYIRNSPGNYEK